MAEPKPMTELTRIREDRGLSQQRLADASGVNKATINQIERGRRSPNVETLEKIADAPDVEVADFFPKAQAPLPLEDRRWSQAENLSGRALDLLAVTVGGLVEVCEALMRGLPEEPTGEEHQQARELFAPLFRRAARIEAKLQAAGLDEDPNALRGAAADKVREIHAAVDRLYELRQEAWVWVNRVRELEKVHGPGQLEAQAESWQRENVEATERRERLG